MLGSFGHALLSFSLMPLPEQVDHDRTDQPEKSFHQKEREPVKSGSLQSKQGLSVLDER